MFRSSSSSSSSFNVLPLKTIRDSKSPKTFLKNFEFKSLPSSPPRSQTRYKSFEPIKEIITEPVYPEREILLRLKATFPQLANPLLRGLDRLFFYEMLDEPIFGTPLRRILIEYAAVSDHLSQIFAIVCVYGRTSFVDEGKSIYDKPIVTTDLLNSFESLLDMPVSQMDNFILALIKNHPAPTQSFPTYIVLPGVLPLMLKSPALAGCIKRFGEELLIGNNINLTRKFLRMPPIDENLYQNFLQVVELFPTAAAEMVRIMKALVEMESKGLIDSKQHVTLFTAILERPIEDLEGLGWCLELYQKDLPFYFKILRNSSCAQDISDLSYTYYNTTRNALQNAEIINEGQNILEFLTHDPHLSRTKRRIIEMLIYHWEIPDEATCVNKSWWDNLMACPSNIREAIVDVIQAQRLLSLDTPLDVATIPEKIIAINELFTHSLEKLNFECNQAKIRDNRINWFMHPMSEAELVACDVFFSTRPEQAFHFFKILSLLKEDVNDAELTGLRNENKIILDLLFAHLEQFSSSFSYMCIILDFVSENSKNRHSYHHYVLPPFKDEIEAYLENQFVEYAYDKSHAQSSVFIRWSIHALLYTFLNVKNGPMHVAAMAKTVQQLIEMGAVGHFTQAHIKRLFEGANLEYFVKELFKNGKTISLNKTSAAFSCAKGFANSFVLFPKHPVKTSRATCIENLPTVLKVNVLSFLQAPVHKNMAVLTALSDSENNESEKMQRFI